MRPPRFFASFKTITVKGMSSKVLLASFTPKWSRRPLCASVLCACRTDYGSTPSFHVFDFVACCPPSTTIGFHCHYLVQRPCERQRRQLELNMLGQARTIEPARQRFSLGPTTHMVSRRPVPAPHCSGVCQQHPVPCCSGVGQQQPHQHHHHH